MYAVVAAGFPAIFRNPTSAALFIAWLAAEIYVLVTGNSLPTDLYPFLDIFVLGVLFAKPEVRSLAPYKSAWHQLKAVLLERSVPDRIVMLAFLPMWFVYVAPLDPYPAWMALWGLSIIQFLAAGCEGYSKLIRWFRARKPTPVNRHLADNVIPFPCRDADATGAYQLARAEGGYG